MASDYSDMDEAALRELLEKADDYEARSKIRAAIRELKKKSGHGIRRQTGSSQYRRPGFQTPRLVTIPNSVTGNVLPSRVADGKSVKPPDKSTPVISYLNSKSEKSPARKSSKDASPSHTYTSQVPKDQPEDNWWRKSHGSSMSTTPTETPEPRERRSSERHLSDSQPEEAFEPPPPRERSPTPEPKEPTPEPPKPRTPTPEPPREPTPSPEPQREPTPSPEPPREPTPSPEPPKEPTPSPEPEREPTPSPEPPKDITPSPEPVEEKIPSPEPVALVEQTPSPPVEYQREHSPSPEEEDDSRDYNHAKYEKDEEEYYDEEDDEDEELRRLEERDPESGRKGSGNIIIPDVPDVLAQTEPGMEEEKDFRKKLRRTEDSNINTAAAFPTRRAAPEQVDFRNLLRKSTGPEKKEFKSGSKAQLDFRTNLKPKDEKEKKEGNVETPPPVEVETKQPINENVIKEPEPESPVQTETRVEKDEEHEVKKEVTKEASDDSYEARREARRREREERRKQLDEIRQEEKPSTESKPMENGVEEDSYEARREARRRAREERHKKALDETSEPRLTYRERKQKEEAKRREEMKANKLKWAEMDQANTGENAGKSPIARQKSSGSQRGAQQLLAWCQHKTRYYENVEVKDFSNSWANGLALCAILHSFVPDLIPYDDLSPDNQRKNYTIALQAAEDVGLESFFDVDDIVAAGSPDPKSMMTFLATIYTHFK